MQPYRRGSALLVSAPSNQLRYSFMLRQEHLVYFVRREFGLTPFQSKLLVYGNRCDNLSEIYQCLVKDGPQQTYLHLFCPDANRLCHICEDVEGSHSFVSQNDYLETLERIREEDDEENSSLLAVGPIPTELSEENEVTHECNICLGMFPLSQIIHLDGYNHHCCIGCVGTFLTEYINCGRVDLTCPHCSKPLKNYNVYSLVDSKTYKKYKLFLGNKLMMKNTMLRWCPNSKCSKVVYIKGKYDRTAECVCGTVLCTKCNREYHPSETCYAVFKKEIQSWSDATDIQKCKKCKSIIQKVSGCNHMTCGFCKYEWCWLCGSTYSPIHFSPLNPFGCPGLQRGDHMAQNWGCLKLWLYRLACLLIILILLPIALPIGLLIAGPALIISAIRDNSWYYYRGCCCKFFIWIIFIIIGLIVNPFAWVGLLVYGIVQGVIFAKRYFQQQRQIYENSTRHLRYRLIEYKINE